MSLPNLVPRGDNTGSLGTASKRWSTIYAYNLDSSTPQSGIFSGSFSGSFEGDGSGLTGVTATATLPSGLVSGSSQISYNGITDVPSGIVSSSTQINSGSFSGSFQGDGSGLTNIVSSSYSLTASYALNSTTLPTGVVSGSSQISYNGITDVPSGILSGSAQISSDISGSFTEASSSFSTRVTTLESVPASAGLWTGSGDFISRLGDVQITGSLTVSSSMTANSFIGNGSGLTNVVSSSYSVTASHATSVGVDSVDVEDLSATGTPSGTTYLRGDNTWATVAGSGDVSKVGTPVDNQVGVWTGDGTIEGNTTFTFDSTTGGVTATSFTGSINTSSIDNFNTEVSRSAASAGFGTGGGTPLPSGLLSGSTQIASDISGSFVEASSSFSSRVTTLESSPSLPSGVLSGSAQIASDISGSWVEPSSSFSTRVTTNESNFNTLNNKTLVSGSSQISYNGITDVPSNILSSSAQISSDISGSFVEASSSFSSRVTTLETVPASLPSGVVSGSSQISYNGITDVPSNIVSSSAQIASDISGSFTSTSASIAVNITTNLTNFNTLNNKTLVSGSSQISYTSITNVPSGILSSSTQIESEISGAFSDTSSSLAGRITSQENFSSSLDATFWTEAEQLVYSGSVSTRFTTNETDITNLQTDSGSFSTRVTTLENETVYSGSFSGSFQGDGSSLTGITAEWDGTHVGNASITGSLVVSQSGTEAMTVYGSGSTLFEVVGSQGSLWSITDSLSGSLFGVGDISGFQQFEVFSNGDVLTGDEAQAQTLHRTTKTISGTGTQTLTTFSTSSYDGAFVDYTMVSASNARAGSIMSIWNNSSIQYTETATSDIGNTSLVTMSLSIVGGSVAVQSTTPTSTWTIKTTTRAI